MNITANTADIPAWSAQVKKATADRSNRRYLKAVRLAKTGDKVSILKEIKTYGPIGVLTDREQDALAILVDCL